MRTIAVVVVALAVLAVACQGDGGERTLRLAHGDFTEAEYRAKLRAAKLDNPFGFAMVCRSIEGLSVEEAAEVFKESSLGEDEPVQKEPDPQDALRATEMWLEECKR